MEITNLSKHSTVVLSVGSRVGQIVFMYTGETEHPYDGKYQTGVTAGLGPEEAAKICRRLNAEWTPESMLPKLWKDREVWEERHVCGRHPTVK